MTAIVVCAQSAIAHAGLSAIASTPSTQVVGKTNSFSALSLWLQTKTADLALIELASAETDTLDELVQLVESQQLEETMPYLLMIDSTNESLFARLLETGLLSGGMVSLLPMTVSASEMKGAIAAITQGLVILHPEIAEYLFDWMGDRTSALEPIDELIEPLTPREIEVLNELANGLTNKAIALNLNISEHTVKFHISTILFKLDVASRTEAVTVGIRAGLVRL